MVCVFLSVVGNSGLYLQEEGTCVFLLQRTGGREEEQTNKMALLVKTLKPGGSCEEMLGHDCF